jgi:hypothetical protein
LRLLLFGGLFALCAGAGSLCFFEVGTPEQTCVSCHEIREPYNRWKESSHRQITCKRCHGGTVGAMRENVTRLVGHFRDSSHDNMALSEEQVVAMTAVCESCHAQEAAEWHAGGHGVAYSAIFLDEKHNATEQLAGDCLRCHGMFYKGNVAALVEPLDTKGPWRLKDPAMANRPAIPCLACHRVHTAGHPAAEAVVGRASPSLYCRREKKHFTLADLPAAKINDHGRPVQVSPDPRQRLCVQCHAPDAFGQAGSGDDRTPLGVHEGIGCLGCHNGHSNDARRSCVQCHPKMSNCGLDVETIDTTFHSLKSKHNIHTVRCTDCHASGRPTKNATKSNNPADDKAKDAKK